MDSIKVASTKIPPNIKFLPQRLQDKILKESEFAVCNGGRFAEVLPNEPDSSPSKSCKANPSCSQIGGENLLTAMDSARNQKRRSRSQSQLGNTNQSACGQNHSKLMVLDDNNYFDSCSYFSEKKDISNCYREDSCKPKTNAVENHLVRLRNYSLPAAKSFESNDKLNTENDSKFNDILDTKQVIRLMDPLWLRFRPLWFDIIHDNKQNNVKRELIKSLAKWDRQIHNIIDDGTFLREWKKFIQIREEIQGVFLKMLKNDLKFCCKENMELYFWKVLFYSIIELFKRCLQQQSENHKIEYLKSKLYEIIQNGIEFYQEALNQLQADYDFKLDIYLEYAYNVKKEHKLQPLAAVSSQRILINLGDLSRYKALFNRTDFFEAQQYYNKAQKLLPTNGIPYNQLALLAIYSKKKFDAIYYHMRSLIASNPINSARESLKVLFDEIRKKHEEILKSTEVKRPKKHKSEMNKRMLSNMRKEIWTHPDGSRRIHSMSASTLDTGDNQDEENLSDIDTKELSKRFTTSFLHIHGMLFAGIGMENFRTNATRMMNEFQELLSRKPFIYSKERVLQITALNIFSIEFNKTEDTENIRTEMRHQAFETASSMFAIILFNLIESLKKLVDTNFDRVNYVIRLEEIDDLKTSQEVNKPKIELNLPDDVSTLLSAVKIWCDWLFNNVNVWKDIALPSAQSELTSFQKMNMWRGFAQILSILANVDIKDDFLKIGTMLSEDYIPIFLEEDIILSGFSTITNTNSIQNFCHKSVYTIAENAVRLKIIEHFGKFLSECNPPILKKSIRSNGKVIFFHALPNISEPSEEESISENDEKFEEISENLDAVSNSIPNGFVLNIEDNAALRDENSEITELLKRKLELQEKHQRQEKYQEKLKSILSNSHISLHIEVHPKYLVPDTNCFIDFLNDLKIVAGSSKGFLLMIPLVVVNELEGLSKGIRTFSEVPSTSEENAHLIEVAKLSKEALLFIRSKNHAIKCVTTKGSILKSSIFTMEDSETEPLTNDDKILTTAISLCKTNLRKCKGDIMFIQTEVVLLTTDRNLRVKALSRNLIVSQLPEFLKWAGLT